MPKFRRPSLWTVLVPVVALVAGLLFATSSRTALGTDLRAGESSQLSNLIEERDAAVAQRLRECVRGTDTIARLGGDEFAVVQVGTHSQPTEAALLASWLVDVIWAPY